MADVFQRWSGWQWFQATPSPLGWCWGCFLGWPGIGASSYWGAPRHPAPSRGPCPCCVLGEERKGKVEEISGMVLTMPAVVVVRLGSCRCQNRQRLLAVELRLPSTALSPTGIAALSDPSPRFSEGKNSAGRAFSRRVGRLTATGARGPRARAPWPQRGGCCLGAGAAEQRCVAPGRAFTQSIRSHFT